MRFLIKDLSIAILLGILFSFFYKYLNNLNFCLFQKSFHFWLLIIINAIWEEVLFRGIIWDFFEEKIKGFLFGPISFLNITIAFLFSLAHLIFGPVNLLRALTFFPALVFGYFREKYNSLFFPILLHFFYNLCIFIWC